MVNHNFNCHGFDEELKFSGLMPKVMDKLGEEFLTGKHDVTVSTFDNVVDGNDPLVVIDTEEISKGE